MKSIYCYLFIVALVYLCSAQAQVTQCVSTNPAAPKVLWITVNFPQYRSLYTRGFNLVKTYATTVAKHKAANFDSFTLSTNSLSGVNLENYNQIWFIDFSSFADNYPDVYAQINSWVNAKAQTRSQVILDGRFASSFWLPFDGYANDHNTVNPQLLYNYYDNLARYDGGMVIGTDHDNYHKTGANALLAALGITQGFSGKIFSTVLEVATNHPLIAYPVNAGFSYPAAVPKGSTTPHFFVWDDSSTAVAPSGSFANGRYNLVVIARHSDGTPAITTSLSETANPVCPFQPCTTSTCVEGRCVYAPLQCGGTTPFCDPTDSKCKGCLSASQCNDNNKCTTKSCENGQCVARPVICLLGNICDQTDGACKQCVVTSDCVKPGQTVDKCNPKVCNNGQCITNPVMCTNAGDKCDPATGVCSRCVQDNDCNDGSLCTINKCINNQCSYPPAVNCPTGST